MLVSNKVGQMTTFMFVIGSFCFATSHKGNYIMILEKMVLKGTCTMGISTQAIFRTFLAPVCLQIQVAGSTGVLAVF